MSVACPKCGRPNADNAKKCIYCSSSLEGAAKIQVSDRTKELAERFLADKNKGAARKTGSPAPVKPRPPKKSATEHKSSKLPDRKGPFKVIDGGKKPKVEPTETYSVVISPVEKIDNDTIKEASDILRMDVFSLRTNLAAGAPWMVRKLDDLKQANDLAANLNAAGIKAYIIEDMELKQIPPLIVAKKALLISGGMRFQGKTIKESTDLRWDEAFLVVLGRIRRKKAMDTARKKKESEFKPPDFMKEYEVVDIYPRTGRGIRLAEGVADFSGLGKYMAKSSLLNLRWLQKGFITASKPIVDESYKRLSKVFKPSAKSAFDSLYNLKREVEREEYLDNSGHYNEHSIFIYFHYSKSGK